MKLSQVAAEQCGVFTRAQARAAGYSRWQIARRLNDGDWTTVSGKVYALAGAVLHDRGRLWAAYLASGEGAAVSHLSAAQLHGLGLNPPTPWITIAPNRHIELSGVRLARVPLSAKDLDFLDGLLVTARERTIVDSLSVLPFAEALAFQDRVLQKRWISYQALALRVQHRFGQQGTPQLRRLLRYAGSDARFEAERRLHGLLRRAGISGWKGNVEVTEVFGQPVVADVLFARLQLVIEVDGRAWHSSGDRFQRDRTRQNALVAAGYTVLRFTWFDLMERPEYVIRVVRDMIERLATRP